ncbi:MAG: septal ring lytic transglycosylase RlpA family protein [Labilithrix sp.]|nr:septal ring lytic transglycosylase RlpA family protein [Labilithrix sp.]
MTFLAVGCAPRPSAPPRAPARAESPVAPEAQGAASAAGGPRADRARADGEPEQVGLASWYGNAFAGKPTASGERFDPRLFTAAHRKLPFGTWVEVRRIDTGRAVRVRINDRGPNGRAAHRVIDLSRRAAEELDIIRAGVVRVELRVVAGP